MLISEIPETKDIQQCNISATPTSRKRTLRRNSNHSIQSIEFLADDASDVSLAQLDLAVCVRTNEIEQGMRAGGAQEEEELVVAMSS